MTSSNERDVNIPNSSENGTQHDDSQQGISSAKRGITDVENPTEDVDISIKNSSDQNGNVEPVKEEPKNPHKMLIKHLETGGWRCKNVLCTAEDDSDMLRCTKCDGKYYYRCTNLPPYQIALFLTRDHRGYRCLSCVKVSEDLLQKCGPHTKTEFEQILVGRNNALKILNEDLKVKSEMVWSLRKAKKTLEEQIKDKDFVIKSQKEVLEKMRMRGGEPIGETTEKGDRVCNGKQDGKQVFKVNAIREELESTRENMESLEIERMRLQRMVQDKKALPNDQSEKMDSLNNEPVAIQEEIVEVKSSHSDNQKMEELSSQLEFANQINGDLKQKIEDHTLLVNKTEIAFKAKEELVGAKSEIIDKLKTIIGNLEETCNRKQEAEENVTSNDNNQLGNNGEHGRLKNGAQECCEFLEVHTTKGFLLWTNIEMQTTPENIWKEEGTAKFLKEEITDAKETLWRLCGDRIPGTVKKRQGASKSVSDVNDICFALKVLAEKDSLPMLLVTSEMIKENPNLKSYPPDNDKKVKSRLAEIEKSINSILDKLWKNMYFSINNQGR